MIVTQPLKLTSLKIAAAIVLAVGLFTFYHFTSIQPDYHSGFNRTITSKAISKLNSFELRTDDHLYLVGATGHYLFLSRQSKPLQLIKVNESLNGIEEMEIEAGSNQERAYMQIDSPFFYVADKSGSRLWKGLMSEWKASQLSFAMPPFIQLVCIDSSHFAIHTTIGKNASQTSNTLGKIRIDSPYVLLNRGLLKEQGEGVYSTDGLLRYNARLKKIVYVYFYRNEIIVTDPQLRTVNVLSTIDTVHLAKLNPIVMGTGSFALVNPPVIVNQNARCYNEYLLIHSRIRAQNEAPEKFKEVSAIDVYDLANSVYRFSFYIPKEDDQEMKNFFVVNDKIIVNTDNRLISYRLNQEYFSSSVSIARKEITDQ